MEIKIHGTYPHGEGKWKTVEHNVSLAKVAELVGIELVGIDNDWGDAVYLWLNKGFVLIDKPEVDGVNKDGYLGMACIEMLGGSPRVNGIKKGDRAIYLHDGNYSIIERVED